MHSTRYVAMAALHRAAHALLLSLPLVLVFGAMENRLCAGPPAVKIVTLGDSITKGVRAGVLDEETFASRLAAWLAQESIEAEVVNEGIGGERTDQALARLDQDIIARRPAIVVVMYGTNDSYVDRGRKQSRLSREEYRANLRELVERLRAAGIRPVLMTEPRWGDQAQPNGVGEHPNVRLEQHMAACREVARDTGVALVDHFEHWSQAAAGGTDVGGWTTDQCHPNARGHEEIAALLGPVVRDELARIAWKRYRLIFNCDGHAVFKDAQGDTQQWLENLFGPLEDSHVDALFWCDGAGGNTANYDSRVLELTGARAAAVDPHLKRLIDEGRDPPELVVAEARRRHVDVFYSFRINDVHDAFLPEELPVFKAEHPEWLLGERDYNGVPSFKTALNFAVPEVRDLKFRVVEELFGKYDFDGLEIDWMRSAPYFPPGSEQESAHLLTDLLQRIREHLNQRGLKRGRPVRLAVRVDESLQSCRLDGFDVPTWIDRGLVDLVVLGSGVIDIEVEEFKQLAAPRNIPVHACLYGWPSKYSPIPAELAAGLGLTYWSQGADGIYLFNWFPHTHNNSERTGPYMGDLLKRLGDPQALLSGSRRLMFAADRGRPDRAYHHNWMHCVLPAPLVLDQPVAFTIRIGGTFEQTDDVRLTLRLAVASLQMDDDLRVELNGQPLDGVARDGAEALIAQLAPEALSLGPNKLVVTCTRLAATSQEPRILGAAEVHVERGGP